MKEYILVIYKGVPAMKIKGRWYQYKIDKYNVVYYERMTGNKKIIYEEDLKKWENTLY